MIPRTFRGATSREVLSKARQALGEDAMIVANCPVDEGIEITALAANALPGAGGMRADSAAAGSGADGVVQQLMHELAAMKAMMQREFAGMVWAGLTQRAPVRAAIMQRLLDAGFSPLLARELTAVVGEQTAAAPARKEVAAEIERRLPLMSREALVEEGGVFALIGPTGVGKTTTVAKLAARCVVRHGAESLALLTTDSYRIAAHDQLRVYGKILGVPVHAIKDMNDLKSTLMELRGKKTILIDTIGMSQRDSLVAEQSALLNGGQVRRLLLLNATANAATLDEVIGSYASGGVYGCIVTKVDEAASLATVLDCAIRHRLMLHYVTNGQRVPEDVHVPNARYLLDRALRPAANGGAHRLQPEEYPLVIAGAPGAAYG